MPTIGTDVDNARAPKRSIVFDGSGPREGCRVSFEPSALILGLLAGIALCLLPYLIDSIGWCIAACVAATLLPLVLQT